jgi:hypothetical protein
MRRNTLVIAPYAVTVIRGEEKKMAQNAEMARYYEMRCNVHGVYCHCRALVLMYSIKTERL